jgi:hypothetical protein
VFGGFQALVLYQVVELFHAVIIMHIMVLIISFQDDQVALEDESNIFVFAKSAIIKIFLVLICQLLILLM